MTKNNKITIELSAEEIAHISLALDRLIFIDKNAKTVLQYSSWEKLQKKWDDLYRSFWRLSELGVKEVS